MSTQGRRVVGNFVYPLEWLERGGEGGKLRGVVSSDNLRSCPELKRGGKMAALLEAHFEDLIRMTGLTEAHPVQLRESKKMFYAGAWALYCLLLKSFKGNAKPTAKDVKLIKQLDAEMREFAQSVARGEA